jgi:hypothetical protein
MTEWKLVPVELVPEMQNALWGQANFDLTPEDYALLIAAAPEPPVDPRVTRFQKARDYVMDALERRDAEIAALREENERLRALVDEARDIIVSAAPGQEVWLDAADEALRGDSHD